MTSHRSRRPRSKGILRALLAALFASSAGLSFAEVDPDSRPPAASINPLAGVAISDMADFVGKPLFTASRRPFQAPPAPAPAPPAAPPPAAARSTANLRLLGVVQMISGSVARIQDAAGGATYSVTRGESVGGWTVTIIGASSVRLEQAGETAELQLFQGNANPAPSPVATAGQPLAPTIAGTPPVVPAPTPSGSASTRVLPPIAPIGGPATPAPFALTVGTSEPAAASGTAADVD